MNDSGKYSQRNRQPDELPYKVSLLKSRIGEVLGRHDHGYPDKR